MTGIKPAAFGALMNGDIENFMVASTPGGIEAQEKRGQMELNKAFTKLPIKGMHEYRHILEKMGFKIGDAVEEIFYSIEAPAGWHTKPTDHAMHSNIFDDKGRVRGSMFYKAAFYDRNASFHLFPRYNVNDDYDKVDINDVKTWRVRKIIHDRETNTSIEQSEFYGYSDWDRDREEGKAMKEKILALFPNAYDVTAYWS